MGNIPGYISFAVITGHTKPATKWAASELKKHGKKVYLVDIFKKPDPDFIVNVAALPSGIDRVVVGITKTIKGI